MWTYRKAFPWQPTYWLPYIWPMMPLCPCCDISVRLANMKRWYIWFLSFSIHNINIMKSAFMSFASMTYQCVKCKKIYTCFFMLADIAFLLHYGLLDVKLEFWHFYYWFFFSIKNRSSPAIFVFFMLLSMLH